MNSIGDVISHNIWVLIPLSALLIPIFAIAIGGWTAFLHYRSRTEAIQALKAFAENGREPPAALVDAVAGRKGRSDWDGDWKADRHRWKERLDDMEGEDGQRWARRRVFHSARGFIWTAAVAIGFFLAWSFIDHNDGFLIVAIIMSCVSAASLLQLALAYVFFTKK